MEERSYFRRHDALVASLAGAAYGVIAQLMARFHLLAELYAVMSFGYVFLLPVVLGVISAMLLEPGRGVGSAMLSAGRAAMLCLAVALVVGWEGSLCLIMAAPIYLSMAMFGALIGFPFRQHRHRGSTERRFALGLCALLPLLSASLETTLPLPVQERVVENSIEIVATPEQVWPQIARVSKITEPQESFFFTMGFPRPVEATLSREGVGGVRHASFERGLLFLETVTVWDPPRRLAFAIEVEPDHTPLTTLDAHVTVGGRYFDVLSGSYRIEPIGARRVRLHLASNHRVSTRFNFYTSLWSDYLMGEIQQNILRVLKQRCERPLSAHATRTK